MVMSVLQTASMSKKPIARGELCARVLAELRHDPSCARIREIAITLQHVIGSGTTWHVSIVDSGDADPALVYVKARKLQEDWSGKFEVVD